MRWAVLGAMLPGAAALVAANFLPKPRPSAWRSAVLVGGGFVYLGWIAAFIWLVSHIFAPDDAPRVLGLDRGHFLVAAVFMGPAPFIALWMAIRMFVSPLEDPPRDVDAA